MSYQCSYSWNYILTFGNCVSFCMLYEILHQLEFSWKFVGMMAGMWPSNQSTRSSSAIAVLKNNVEYLREELQRCLRYSFFNLREDNPRIGENFPELWYSTFSNVVERLFYLRNF
ncbi:hypothetical protein M758_5G038100 [Ceratodon purpureus]|nr:hypothetical protein M758_5G038100 [Ceratodon purpureus]